MTREKFNQLNQAAVKGTIKDNQNPVFAYSSEISDAVLVAIAKGVVDAQELAKRLLESRGLNIDGQWVGFNKQIK